MERLLLTTFFSIPAESVILLSVMQMTTDQMKSFITAAEYLNFTKAAEQLFITQSAISRQIGALEAELATQLFIRQNSQIRLTAAGELLYRGLSKIYDDYTILLHSLQEVSSGLTGELRIGVLDDQTIEPWVSALLTRFAQDRPNVKISFIRLDLQGINSSLQKGDIDLGITIFRGSESIEGANQYVYALDQMYLAVPRRLMPEGMDPDAPETFETLLSRLPMTMIAPENFGNTLTSFAWNVLNNKILRTEIRFETSLQSLQDLVTSGLYCTVANESNVFGQHPDMVLVTAQRFGKIRKGIRWMTSNTNALVPLIVGLIQEASPCPQELTGSV